MAGMAVSWWVINTTSRLGASQYPVLSGVAKLNLLLVTHIKLSQFLQIFRVKGQGRIIDMADISVKKDGQFWGKVGQT